MSRYTRHQSIISRHSDESISDEMWLHKVKNNLQKGAVQPRSQDSLFDQINSIMNGNAKSKYSSVEAAVEDMKARSGLTEYLKKSSDHSKIKQASAEMEQLHSQIKSAAVSEDWYQVGYLMGKLDSHQGQVLTAVESLKNIKKFEDPELNKIQPPMNKWLAYTMGYSTGTNKNEEEFKTDMKHTMSVINRINLKKKALDNNAVMDKNTDDTPIVIKKYPTIMNTIQNYIRDTKGNLPVPAILDKIKSIHQADCSDGADWEDEKLIRLVSRLNLEAKKSNPDNYMNYTNLGSHDNSSNSEIDPANTDAFFGLNPAKM